MAYIKRYSSSRHKRHARVRGKVSGTAQRPRLCVFRSLNHIYAQVIDDVAGHTMAAASSKDAGVGGPDKAKLDVATAVGSLVAERAKAAGIDAVIFDRGGYQYHGRVKALADGARAGGLVF
jgi:large subunit ribosomal protein L18